MRRVGSPSCLWRSREKHTRFESESEPENLFCVLVTDWVSLSGQGCLDDLQAAGLCSAAPRSGAKAVVVLWSFPVSIFTCSCLDAFWPCWDGKGCLRALTALKEALWGVRALQIYGVVAGHQKSVNLIKFASGMCRFKGSEGFGDIKMLLITR